MVSVTESAMRAIEIKPFIFFAGKGVVPAATTKKYTQGNCPSGWWFLEFEAIADSWNGYE